MKLLLAGPGTGKTTKIKSIIDSDFSTAKKITVLSFTNATVNDLVGKFSEYDNVSCSTLHSFALKYNHLPDLHILITAEQKIVEYIAEKTEVEYDHVCKLLRCIDFNSMITECVSFIKANPTYMESNIGEMDLLIVDEFQDFNPIEQEFVMLISKYAKQTFILGDDDQSIYGFKDADPDGIITLHDNPEIDKIEHENKCYRCPDKVVDASRELIENNHRRVKKEWHKTGKEGGVTIIQYKNQQETNTSIIRIIKQIMDNDAEASILILSPVGFAVKGVKDLLVDNNIEYVDFWNGGIDSETLKEVWWLNLIYGNHKFLFTLLLIKQYKLVKPKTIDYLKRIFMTGFDEIDSTKYLLKNSAFSQELVGCVFHVMEFAELTKIDSAFSKYEEYLDFENIEISVNELMKTINKPKEFEHGKINMMSIHKSKGLESDYVIINGLVNGILPNAARGMDTIEAQRRLLFVGMTRTKKELYLITTVEWDGADAHKVDFEQFKFDYRSKKYKARASQYIEEVSK